MMIRGEFEGSLSEGKGIWVMNLQRPIGPWTGGKQERGKCIWATACVLIVVYLVMVLTNRGKSEQLQRTCGTPRGTTPTHNEANLSQTVHAACD